MGGLPVLMLVFLLIIWVVVQVVRAQANEVKNNPPNRRNAFDPNRADNQGNNPEGNRTPERSSANDIDRFLQEIDRLRQRAAKPKEGEEKPAPRPQPVQQQSQSAPPQTQQPPRPRPIAQRPQPQPRPQTPAKPQPAPRPEPPRPTSVSPPPAATPAPSPPPAPPVVPPPATSQADQKFAEFSTPPTVSITSSLVGAAPATKVQVKESAVVDLIRTMLKQPKGFAAALLLKEILDPPRSAKR